MMGHPQRIEGTSYLYYISSVGINGQKLFIDDGDRLFFIDLLRQQKIKHKLVFYAYVLLKSQYDFLMETSKSNLSQSMHHINSGYANFFNRRHMRQEKVFKERFRSLVLNEEAHLVELSLYLHLLPRRKEETKSGFLYRWSSLPGYLDREKREDWIDYDILLGRLNKNASSTSLAYRRLITQSLDKQIPSPFASLKGSAILWDEEFRKKIKEKSRLNEKLPTKDETEAAKKITNLAKKAFPQSPILSRNAAIYLIKKYTGLSNREIMPLFRPLKQSSISQMSRRFRQAMDEDKQIEQTTERLGKKINEFILNEI